MSHRAVVVNCQKTVFRQIGPGWSRSNFHCCTGFFLVFFFVCIGRKNPGACRSKEVSWAIYGVGLVG